MPPEHCLRSFTSDPQIVSMVVRAIHISTLSVIPLGIQYEIVDGFTAMGCVRYSFALSFFRKFVYFTALFLLPRFLHWKTSSTWNLFPT